MSNVIELTPEIRRKKRTILERTQCRHRRVALDDVTQLLECDDCSQQVSPYVWLCTWGWEISRTESFLQDIKKDLHEKAAELEEVNRKLRNAKACLKRRGLDHEK